MTTTRTTRTVVLTIPMGWARRAGTRTRHAARVGLAGVLATGLVTVPALVLGTAPSVPGSSAADAAEPRVVAAPAGLALAAGQAGGQFVPDASPSVIDLGSLLSSPSARSDLGWVAATGALGIPATVLDAYKRAGTALAATNPTCGLPWWLLAGIGRVESGHAAGGRVDAHGTTLGKILGPRLDGSLPGTAIVRDSDLGLLDGDPVFDRAVGPMQFLPRTWQSVAADGNGDGVKSPHNVYDAALAAARYLCSGGANLRTTAGLTSAVLRYNYSSKYVATVLTWGNAYRQGAAAVPSLTGRIPAGTGSFGNTPAFTPSPTPTTSRTTATPTTTTTPPTTTGTTTTGTTTTTTTPPPTTGTTTTGTTTTTSTPPPPTTTGTTSTTGTTTTGTSTTGTSTTGTSGTTSEPTGPPSPTDSPSSPSTTTTTSAVRPTDETTG
ncbi:MAG TPA: lytic murein transglycosylase [Dermatophilaceae bacterium]|nr:lytic murein transglycosylase [Dermatophilaceae bacterium]